MLAWLRAQSEYVLIPDGAVYSPECSRAVTGEGAAPTAAFTFGKESPYRDLLRRAASGDEAARDEFNNRRADEEARERTAELEVRKANVLIYKRHEAELAPILDALLELSEE